MADNAEKVLQFLKKNPVLIAGTMGFDKKPQLHKAELCFAEGGALYFAAPKCGSFYGELSQFPDLTLCAYDPEGGTLLRLKGKAVFDEDPALVGRCLDACPALAKAWGHEPGMLIAWFLKDLSAEFLHDNGTREEAVLGLPENVITGITWKKDKELRDRLVRIMERREAEAPAPQGKEELRRQKLWDGTLLYLAETAKEVWPRMDIQPAERSVLFETYDEREEYTALARKRLGNARIEKPEDLTYWLSEASADR